MNMGVTIIACVILFFFGAAVYSFLNVVIFRVPRGEEFIRTRSHCPGCGRVLTPLELIPVVSYICLGGKCKNCGSKIGLRDVSIEIFGGLSAIAAALYFVAPVAGTMYFPGSILQGWLGYYDFMMLFYGALAEGATVFALIGILTVICFINLDTGKVKTGTLIALAVIGTIGLVTMYKISIPDRLIGAACGLLPFLLLGLLTKNRNLSLAGVILAVIGCVSGWKSLVVVAMIAVVLGALWAIVLLLTGNKKLEGRFRLIPVICLAVAIGFFATDWLTGMLIL